MWAEYAWSVALPCELSPDWSYPAIPPIETVRDPRLPLLTAFLSGWAAFWWRCAIANTAPRALVAVVGFGIVPYLLASNLLFPVGTCKVRVRVTVRDRVRVRVRIRVRVRVRVRVRLT